jgi:hypothetical protein
MAIQSGPLFDGGSRGRPRSDRRASVYPVRDFCSIGLSGAFLPATDFVLESERQALEFGYSSVFAR